MRTYNVSHTCRCLILTIVNSTLTRKKNNKRKAIDTGSGPDNKYEIAILLYRTNAYIPHYLSSLIPIHLLYHSFKHANFFQKENKNKAFTSSETTLTCMSSAPTDEKSKPHALSWGQIFSSLSLFSRSLSDSSFRYSLLSLSFSQKQYDGSSKQYNGERRAIRVVVKVTFFAYIQSHQNNVASLPPWVEESEGSFLLPYSYSAFLPTPFQFVVTNSQ